MSPGDNQTEKRINKFSGSPRFPFFLKIDNSLLLFPLPLLSVQSNHTVYIKGIFLTPFRQALHRNFFMELIHAISEDIIPDEPKKSRKNRDDRYEAKEINCHTDIFWVFLSIA